MPRYVGTISFTSDQPLTQAQIDTLVLDVATQIIEPREEVDGDLTEAEWRSGDVEVEIVPA